MYKKISARYLTQCLTGSRNSLKLPIFPYFLPSLNIVVSPFSSYFSFSTFFFFFSVILRKLFILIKFQMYRKVAKIVQNSHISLSQFLTFFKKKVFFSSCILTVQVSSYHEKEQFIFQYNITSLTSIVLSSSLQYTIDKS